MMNNSALLTTTNYIVCLIRRLDSPHSYIPGYDATCERISVTRPLSGNCNTAAHIDRISLTSYAKNHGWLGLTR